MKIWLTRAALFLMAAFFFAGCGTVPKRAATVEPYRPAVETPDTGAVPSVPATNGVEAAADPGMDEPALRTLMPGDRLMITLRVYPKTETFETVIDETGSINLDLVGRIKVAGKSSAEAERIIEKAYIDGMYYKTITASIIPPVREFFVKGYVIRPGNYPMTRGKVTVLQALTMAGGWNEFADPGKVRLIRGEEIMILNIPKIQARTEQDMYIEPGDVIDVPKRWM